MAQFGRYSSSNYLEGASRTIMQGLAMKKRSDTAKATLKEKMLGRKSAEKAAADKLALETKKYETGLPWLERSASAPDKLGKTLTPDVETAPQGSASQDLQQMNPELNAEAQAQGEKYETIALSEVTPGEIAASEVSLAKRMESLGVKNFKEPAKEIASFVKQMKGKSRFFIYNKTKQNWNESLKLPGLDKIKQSMATTSDLEESARLTKLYNAWDSGAVIDEMFPNSVTYAKQLAMGKAADAPKTLEAVVAASATPEEAEKLLREMKGKQERLYPTTEGYQPRTDAIGKKKPKSETSAQPRSMKTYTLPDGSTKTIPNNQKPPEGAVPFKDPRMFKKDLQKTEELIIANMNDPRSEPHIKRFNEDSDASYFYLFDPGKKEGVIRNFFGSSDDKTTKIKLPIIKGRQTTLKDLRETAKKHNKTLEQVLKEYAEKQKKGKK